MDDSERRCIVMFLTRKNHITAEWINTLLINVIKNLPIEYNAYVEQINDGIIEKVYKQGFASTVQPNYIGFGYDKRIVSKYDKLGKIDPVVIDKLDLTEGFILSGIEIYNIKEKRYIEIELYFADGLIAGIDSAVRLDMISFDYEKILIKKLVKRET